MFLFRLNLWVILILKGGNGTFWCLYGLRVCVGKGIEVAAYPGAESEPEIDSGGEILE